ncbi:MAG: hypothetical protein H6562_25085 [Lewinellaceae bacterium]|nr:hypothetical protein [Lewinella sp.]MCB9282188.1 hypothetical protein [Lewinellaceae bacterium]
MPKQRTDDLIQLIRSLSRAEKRHFRLFVRRNQNSDDILFLQLFDLLEKYKEYDEDLIQKRLPAIKKTQLSNLKAHLYKQLLISLRLLNSSNNEDIQIREMIDFARILYNKGLYRQSLEILERAKVRAMRSRFYSQAMEIIEFEKQIEGQYITRSIEGRAEELTEESRRLNDIIVKNNEFSNLAIQLYGLYLKVGYVRSYKDYVIVQEFFQSNVPRFDYKELDFWGKVFYCQAFVWFYHMTQDFPMTYRYAQKWVNLFHENDGMIELNPAMYLKGIHNLLGALFNSLHYDKFVEVLNVLNRFPDKFDITVEKNIEGLFNLFKYVHFLEKHFLEGTFTNGLTLVPEIIQLIETDEYNWDHHRVMIFYYRIACLYFGSGNNGEAIDFLNRIINQKNPDYREDIQCFARILNLIAHFELGNAQLVEYQVKSVYRFLLKMENLQEVQKEIFRFIRKTPRMRESELRNEFISLKEKLSKLENMPFERRPFLYLDIISWLESKIERKPVQSVIREKFLKRQHKNPDN